MLDPVQFFYADDSEYEGIDPMKLGAIGAVITASITQALEPEYPVVQTHGPGVIRLRIAVTEMRVQRPERPMGGPLAFMPVGIAINALSAAGSSGELSGSNFVVEALDSASGVRLAVRVDPEPGRRTPDSSHKESLRQYARFYAARLRELFDQERGR